MQETRPPWELPRPLLVLAHHGDECLFAGLLQRTDAPSVVVLTDSAPEDEAFWRPFGSRLDYAEARRQESVRGLAQLGLPPPVGLDKRTPDLPSVDQQLFQALSPALDALRAIVDEVQPGVLVAPAYEGGHPDQDAASLLTALVARERSLPHWDAPMYHRTPSGSLAWQRFRHGGPRSAAVTLDLGPEALAAKRRMWAQYRLREQMLGMFDPEWETYRPAPAYDYSRPPHFGTLHYETWPWPVDAAAVCTAFRKLLAAQESRSPLQGFKSAEAKR